MGKLIVIEGLDGSGKATQAKRLVEAARARGLEARGITFPNYESPSSAPVRMYLSGAFGSKPGDVNAYAASSFYAVDRYAGFKADWGTFYTSGGVLIADRYTTSNAVHQCCKLPRDQWDHFLAWLFDYEYRLLGIPRPDRVIYLHGDVALSRALLSRRYGKDAARADIHERDEAYLARAQEAAEYCCEKYGWMRVECLAGGMRTIDDIADEIARRALDAATE